MRGGKQATGVAAVVLTAALLGVPGPSVAVGSTDPTATEGRQVAAARLVIVATPIYKAAYSGLLKTFLDLLPQDVLRGKTVLPLATGGSAAHLLALDYALRPVLAALRARHQLDAVYACDAQLARTAEGYAVPGELAARIERALAEGPYPLRRASLDEVALAA